MMELLSHPLVWPIALSLAIGLVAYVLSRAAPFVAKALALAAAVVVLIGGLSILLQTPDAVLSDTWAELTPTVRLDLDLAATKLGLLVMIGAAAFTLLIAIYSFRAMAGEYWEGKFYAYLVWTMAGACIVALAGNLIVLLIGWEIVTLMLFLLVNQGRQGARAGAAKAYGMLGFADACLLLAIALLIVKGGTAALSLHPAGGAMALSGTEGALGATGYIAYILILIAALAKAGAVPVHTWIPSVAQDAPTPIMAYLPAALDKLLGIYLLAVLSLYMFKPDGAMQIVMMVIGAVTILAAVLMAMLQHNLKKLLSFHAVSQVGYMVLGIGTGTMIGVVGGLFHMLNHSIYKCCLFLMSGTAGRAAESDEVEDMGGLARYLPVTFLCGLIAAAAISGVPPFNGFVSKWLVYAGTLSIANQGLAIALVVAAVFGSALTLASFVKVMYSAFLSPVPKDSPVRRKAPRESLFLAAPMVVLAAACVFLGLFPNTVLNDVFVPAVPEAAVVGDASAVSADWSSVVAGKVGVWRPGTAMVLIAIGLIAGWALYKITKIKVRVVRPFLAGEVPAPADDRFRVPGTHFYETVSKLQGVGPLLAEGERGAMDMYHWTSRYGRTFVDVLRGRHTGLVNLYVAWVLLGLTVTLVYLLLSAGT